MRFPFLVGAVAGLVAVCQPVVAAPTAPALEAYGALPEVEQMVLSPSGNRFAALTTLKGRRVIAVLDANMNLIRQFEVADMKVRGIEFATDEMLLLRRSGTQELPYGFTQDKIELHQAVRIPLSGGEASIVFADRADMLDATFGSYGIRTVGGQAKAYFGGVKLGRDTFGGGYHFENGVPGLYEVDLATGRSSLVDAAGSGDYDRDWLVGADGKVLARMDVSKRNGEWTLRDGADRLLAKGASSNGKAWMLGAGKDASSVLVALNSPGTDATQWYEIALAGGGEMKPFLPDLDVEELYFDNRTGFLTGYRELDSNPVYFDPLRTRRHAAITKAFPGRNATPVDIVGAFDKVLVATDGNGDSGSYFIVDLAAKRADPVGLERPAILPEHVGPISTVAYKASDGLDLDGILTLPPGRDAKGLPLVVLPHGGPHARDEEGFDWWAQAFAARGYAVFQPNFRGSTGKGSAFMRAGYGQWGGKMQTDISDGVAHLASQGVVDPERACIVGASYGGYAALAGVTIQQGLYRCAVSVAGVADVGAMSRLDQRESGGSRILRRSLAEELGPSANYRAISPRFQAARADAPIMLIHGRQDTVVAYDQSLKMADALKDAGKPYEFVELAGEDHWLSLSQTRLAMLKAAVGFVEKHNPAD